MGNLPAYSTKAFLSAPRERALWSTSAPPACDPQCNRPAPAARRAEGVACGGRPARRPTELTSRWRVGAAPGGTWVRYGETLAGGLA